MLMALQSVSQLALVGHTRAALDALRQLLRLQKLQSWGLCVTYNRVYVPSIDKSRSPMGKCSLLWNDP